MIPLCRDQGVGLVPWSPLARGRLARAPGSGGTKRSGADAFGESLYAAVAEADGKVLSALDAVARKHRLPHAQVALAWLLRNEAVVAPIVGATRMEHLETAVGALEVRLSPEDVTTLESAYVPHPIAGFS